MASAAADARRRSISKKKIVYNIVARRNAGAGSCPSKFKIPFFETEPRGPDTLDEIHVAEQVYGPAGYELPTGSAQTDIVSSAARPATVTGTPA